MRSYLTEKGYISALQDTDDATIISKALAAIRLGVEDGPLLQISNKATAKEAWTALEELYSPKGFNSKFLLCKELFETTLESAGSIESYTNTIRRLYDQLKAKGVELPKQVIIAWTLNNLTEEYDSFVTSITQNLRSNEDAFSIETLLSTARIVRKRGI